MVHRHIEESLNLVGMEVHGNKSVDSGHAEEVCHKFRRNRNPRFVLAVLTGPSEIGYYGIDAAGRRALGRVNHQQKLHKVLAAVEGGLDQIDLASAD